MTSTGRALVHGSGQDAQLLAVVKRGKTGTMMPPFEGTLTDAEMDAVTRYVQRLAAAGT